MFELIASAETSKEAWDLLKKSFGGVEKMRWNGETIQDARVMEKILQSLVPKYKMVAITIKESNDLEHMSVEQLMGSLQAYEERVKAIAEVGKKEEVKEKEEVVEDKIIDKTRKKKYKLTTIKGDVAEDKVMTETEVTNYQKFGHYASECWHRKENKVQFVEKEEKMQDDILLMACRSSEASESSTWYLDTGASNHICGSKECFAEHDESYSGKIAFGHLSRRPVRGKGWIMLELKNGEHKYIGGVYFVPDMKNNILSVGQLLEKVYEIQMKDSTLQM
ncbi:uncharacterized protein LOC123204352 [Mangifera indica]|uniref:uncharacterized protein LOC123204352 n=1 Tax=Mangifera indica TaxID=29780 RepID=UPI001CF99A34|nr:uncharacterized protein LOC123204352 [Mangifera indica]